MCGGLPTRVLWWPSLAWTRHPASLVHSTPNPAVPPSAALPICEKSCSWSSAPSSSIPIRTIQSSSWTKKERGQAVLCLHHSQRCHVFARLRSQGESASGGTGCWGKHHCLTENVRPVQPLRKNSSLTSLRFHQVNHFFRTLTEQHPILCKRDFFAPSNEQFFPAHPLSHLAVGKGAAVSSAEFPPPW